MNRINFKREIAATLDNAVGGAFEAPGEGFELAAAGGNIRTPGGQPQAEGVGAGLAGGELLVRPRLEALGKIGQPQVGLLDALPRVDQPGGFRDRGAGGPLRRDEF